MSEWVDTKRRKVVCDCGAALTLNVTGELICDARIHDAVRIFRIDRAGRFVRLVVPPRGGALKAPGAR